MSAGDTVEPRTDAELIAAINAGDQQAFAPLYFRYRDFVARLAYRFTANRDDAMDVVQETFSYLLRKFPGFELSASMTTFLYPAVKHLALAARRKRLRPSGDEAAIAELPAPASDPQASTADLAATLASLTDAHREVVLMRFVDAMSLEEIAESLDVPLGTVKSRLHHALKALRDDPRTRNYFLPR